MRELFIAVAFTVLLSPNSWAVVDEEPAKHVSEIKRLSQWVVENNFAPIKVVTEGKNLADALAKAAQVVSEQIGLKDRSSAFCQCLKRINIIPPEQSALLKRCDYTIKKSSTSESSRVTLVIMLESRHLKQFALFEMWPLFDQGFLQKVSS